MTLKGTNITIGKIVNQPGSTFNGELQMKYNVVLSGYVARGKDDTLQLWIVDTPGLVPLDFSKGNTNWQARRGSSYVGGLFIDNRLFPDVKWEDVYPTEVKIRIM